MKHYLGIDLGGTNLKGAIFTEALEMQYELSVPTEETKGPESVMQNIIKTCHELISSVNISPSEVSSLGLGIPGLLDPETGFSYLSPNFTDWENIAVADYIQKGIGIPTYIDNDVRMNLYGEWLYGSRQGYQNIVLVTIGTGLGSGLVVNGRVVYGASASAGEVGHMQVVQDGRPCRCGGRGCLGRYVSARGMVNTINQLLDEGCESILTDWTNDTLSIEADMISSAYDAGDPLAIEVMQFTGEKLGYGLSNLVNLINPERIIIGGGVAAAGDRLLDPVRAAMKKHALPLSNARCEIVTASLGSRAGLIGAASYW